jgi:hypothetical protein
MKGNKKSKKELNENSYRRKQEKKQNIMDKYGKEENRAQMIARILEKK